MEEFESTIGEDERGKRVSSICVVYDKRDGRIVHVHEFVGDGTGLFGKDGKEERSRMALETARQRAESSHLETLDAPAGFRIEPEKVYRVDLSARKLIARAPKRPAMRELIDRRLKNS